MKKAVFLSLALTTIIATGCQNKNKSNNKEMEVIELKDLPNTDKTTYGVVVGEGTSMNELMMITDSGDTINVDLMTAKEKGQQLGGLASGDRVAVMIEEQPDGQKVATEVININSLLGIWIMPNPMDGSDYVGMVIKEGGIAESINQSSLFYKSWKIFNGKLVLTADHEGGGDYEEIDTFQIKVLGADSLVIKGAEDTFEYGRSSKMPRITVEEESFM